jgi:hypothetical protein
LSAGGVYDGYTNKTTVPLTVECTGTEAPKITFSSSQFDSTNKYITRNTASNNGAGFAVYYGNEQVNPESGIQLTKTADNKYVLTLVRVMRKLELVLSRVVMLPLRLR